MNVVVVEFSLIGGAVCPAELSSTMFLAIDVISLILSTVRPGLSALAMLLILSPVALILGSVSMHILAISVSLVIFPLTLVNIAVSVNKSSKTIGLVILPDTFVERSISPDLLASAITLFSADIPLSLVLSAIFKVSLIPIDSLNTVSRGVRVFEVTELSLNLLDFFIIVVALSIKVRSHSSHGLSLKAILLLYATAGNNTTEKCLDLHNLFSVNGQEISRVLHGPIQEI
jgi:hypothetical protein